MVLPISLSFLLDCYFSRLPRQSASFHFYNQYLKLTDASLISLKISHFLKYNFHEFLKQVFIISMCVHSNIF